MNTEQLKTADKTLLDQIKDQVAEKYGQISWKYAMQNNGSHGISALWEIVCERFATAKAKASCESRTDDHALSGTMTPTPENKAYV